MQTPSLPTYGIITLPFNLNNVNFRIIHSLPELCDQTSNVIVFMNVIEVLPVKITMYERV